MSQGPAERRSAPRYTVIMDAQVLDLLTRSAVRLRCSDISLTGCYLDTLNPLDANTPVYVRLEHSGHIFESQGKIAYMVPNLGMGVAFAQPLPAEQLLVLSEWIQQVSGAANSQSSLFGAGAAR